MISRAPHPQSHTPSRWFGLDRNDPLFIAGLILCSLTFNLSLYLGGNVVTPTGPCLAMANTTKAIWDHGTLTSQHARDVFEAAKALSQSTQSDVWQDVFAQDNQGALVPKHSVLSSLIAAPLYGIFGDFGFWVCQHFFFLVLSCSFYQCVKALSGAAVPVTSLLALCLLSPAITASYTFGHDLHGITFMMAGLYLSRARPFLGAVVLGCAVFVRPSYSIAVAPLLFAWADPKNLGSVVKGALGALCALTALCLYNLYLWGDPLTTAYSHLPSFSRGEIRLQNHPFGFDPHEFARDWQLKLFGPDGLFSRYGTFATIPCAIWMALRSSSRTFYGSCLVASTLNTAYMFSYAMWGPEVSPHRFFFPSIVLCLIPFTVLAGQLETWLRKRSASSPPIN
jgi:hypothetical protein